MRKRHSTSTGNRNQESSTALWAREKPITERFGLSHMILFKLRKDGKIRSISTKGEGDRYGARLYNIASIEAWLASQEALENAREVAKQ